MAEFKGFFKTPCFYYGIISIILLSLVYFGINRLPKAIIWQNSGYLKNVEATLSDPVLKNSSDSKDGVLFFTQSQTAFLEPPELKIIEGDSLAAIASPRVLSLKVLGAIFGQEEQPRKEIIEYTVQSGDTLKSIAQNFNISLNTLLWANDLNSSSKIKAGRKLIILPVSGVIHFVKSGDTLGAIAKTYKAQTDEIIEMNEIADESDIYIGDILVVPNGIMPKITPVYPETYLANSYFIPPTEGRITQALHWYNGVDIGNECGTPIRAAASGIVLRAQFDWITGGGNYITIKHDNGVVTWYGHLMKFQAGITPGKPVDVGQVIGFMGGKLGMMGAGNSTGCHLHFTVIGAKNPFRNMHYGDLIKYAK